MRETFFNIGCRKADGLTDDSAILNLKTGMEVSGHGCPAEWLLG